MAYLLDTGILLRLVNRKDPQHIMIRAAMRQLRQNGERLVMTAQNCSEFWNVCTRPSTARGGYGMSVETTDRKLRLIERLFDRLPDVPAAYTEWRRLIVGYRVMGVQVHDARIVAMMRAQGVAGILTLNAADFVRFDGIAVATPETVVGPAGP